MQARPHTLLRTGREHAQGGGAAMEICFLRHTGTAQQGLPGPMVLGMTGLKAAARLKPLKLSCQGSQSTRDPMCIYFWCCDEIKLR